ncbi:hypothetical protein AALP_AAs51800U000500 [Arabis alpina]|uniref:Embryo surrounding factor 1 brassicaceae domain-containing protein n=1 Tax=Arabis alpina TaxID=50452 RepID=A0A087G050_ARAAL|nr:hypothetical protein AALP_AAs51800U000500 [Arabis alpina]
MKSHTSLIFMFMLSLFALHQCAKMDVREIEKPNKIVIPNCIRDNCGRTKYKKCWCCVRNGGTPCWWNQASCESKCPPLNLKV